MSGYKKVGEGKYEVYRKKKIDWEAVGGAIFLIAIIIAIVAGS